MRSGNGLRRRMNAWIAAAVAPLALVLAACEDEGNPGDDSLLSGASLIIVVLVLVVIVGVVVMRRRSR